MAGEQVPQWEVVRGLRDPSDPSDVVLYPPHRWGGATATWRLPRALLLLPAVWGLQDCYLHGIWVMNLGFVPWAAAMVGDVLIKVLCLGQAPGIEYWRILSALFKGFPTLTLLLYAGALLPWTWAQVAAGGAVAAALATFAGWIPAFEVLKPLMGVLHWLNSVGEPYRWHWAPPKAPKPPPKARTAAAPAGPYPKMMPPLPVPIGAPNTIVNILRATDHYSVLGGWDHSWRQRGIQQTFEAADVLDSKQREQYDREIEAAAAAQRAQPAPFDHFQGRTSDEFPDHDTNSAMVKCTGCAEGVHECPLVPGRNPMSARYCRPCDRKHPVSNDEFWIEGNNPLRLLVCIDAKIYDASQVGHCQGILNSNALVNGQDKPCKFQTAHWGSGGDGSGGSGGRGGRGRGRGRNNTRGR